MILYILAGVGTRLAAQSLTFEGFIDSTALNNQYTGAMFSNAIILGAGITLNEFEFPTHSGSNVVSDNGGPITIVFASPMRGFSGYFTYGVPLTLQAFGSSNNVLATVTSSFSSNQALSGVSGSHANELLQVSSTSDVYKIVITGGAQGSSFTLDDASLITRCDVDSNGATNAADVQAVINAALGIYSPANDLNRDGIVNVVDVQIVIDAAAGSTCAAQ